jgi:hypothetical protein
MTSRTLIAAACLTGLCLMAAPAQADWERVTAPRGGTADDQVAVLRTTDGVLHVAWVMRTDRNTETLWHTAVAPDGTIGASTRIATDWLELHNPALVAGPDGLRVFFGGLHTSHPDDPNAEVNTAVSVDGGATWALRDGSITQPGPRAYLSDVSAAVQADGAPLVAWAGEAGVFIHRGLDPAVPYAVLPGAQGFAPGVAANGALTVVAWYSPSPSRRGVWVQDVAADGTPAGGAVPMPGTTTTRVLAPGRTPVAARPGGGIFVAYPTGSRQRSLIRLWSIGARKAPVVTRASGGASATVTAAADGRLWVAWTTRVGGREHVLARRSNAEATEFGAVVDAGRPEGLTAAYAIDGSDAGGALDLLAAYGRSGTSRVATYLTRVLPGLTLERSGSRFIVTDAGNPVPGVRVRVGGRSGRTDERGRVTLSTGGASTATATARGYTPATLSLG